MTTVVLPDAISADVVADLEHVAAAAVSGTKPDPEVVRRVRERADRSRVEIYRRNGLLDIAVPAIRELRDT